jgi:hypothetical protein
VKQWEEIRGEMNQTATSLSLECAQVDALRISARLQMESMMRAFMRKDGTDDSSLYLAEMQLAVSPPGKGEQKPHYDLINFLVASQSHVIIFYCDDTTSTAVPVHSLKKMRPTFVDGEKKLSVAAHSLAVSEDSYKCFPVLAGSALHMSALALHLQPIELIWGFTKSIVARQSTRTRSVHEVAVQTRHAMDQVDAELCRKLIARMHRWIQQFMHSEEGGSLRRFLDLPLLMWASNQSLQPDDIAAIPSLQVEEDADDHEEAQWTQ